MPSLPEAVSQPMPLLQEGSCLATSRWTAHTEEPFWSPSSPDWSCSAYMMAVIITLPAAISKLTWDGRTP